MRLLVSCLTTIGLLASAVAAAAAPSTVAELALYAGADRQSLLEQGARKEGKILVYAIGAQADPVYAGFAKKYPFVTFQVAKADAPTTARRVLEEYRAGVYNVDALDLAVIGLRTLKDSGVLQPYKSPEMASFDKNGIDADGFWAIDYQSFVGLGYNQTLVSDEEAPKTYDDLLDPKWRGRMAVPGASTLANFIGAALADRGEAFVQKLADQNIRTYQVGGRAVANLIVSGEIALSPAIFNSHMANSRSRGARVGWRALGGVYSTTGALGLAARAPHPHAALLFIDYVLSLEGQKIYHSLGYASARTDIADNAKPEKVYFFGDDPDYPKNYEKWMAIGRKITAKK